MTTKINSIGIVYGKDSVSLSQVSVLTPFLQNMSAFNYLRGTNGSNTLGGAGRPYMSSLVVNSGFTLSNLGAGATSASWMYMK